MISLSKQTIQHIIDLLKEDWDCGELEKDGIPMNDGEKMIVFLEGELIDLFVEQRVEGK